MKQIKLLLAPQPGAKPEYVDDVTLVSPSPAVLALWNQQLPDTLVLEGYTRETWAWKPHPTAWVTVTIASATQRQKLPGFCDYLKQRQKSCYGRWGTQGVAVVAYTQPSQYKTIQPFCVDCRIATDMKQIPKCNLKPKVVNKPVVVNKPAPKKAGGFLGKLVGAQQRTTHLVASAATVKKAAAPPTSTTTTATETPAVEMRTASQVLQEFRQAMHDKMLDFDLEDSQEVLSVELSLKEHTAGLGTEDKQKVTMEILKYMVYEAAEEVNEEWVAHKEPSEFMDECVIKVYKEGAAPAEVLEEINKGELPDEVRGQQRAIQEERHRQANMAESRHKQMVEQDAHRYGEDEEDEDDFAVLNTNKRDRRTIEDYERERAKRGRTT